jgi:carbonic anhydrase/acetyltransferase-like protein (isoleucine patch superfamily)
MTATMSEAMKKWITAPAERIDCLRVLVVRNGSAADAPLGERRTVRAIRPVALWRAPGASVVGDVEIGAGSSVWFGCTARGDMAAIRASIRIGAGSNIQDGSMIHVSSDDLGTVVGDDVVVGHMCLIHACTLEDRAFVGSTACILDGAVVESDAMLAAGSLLLGGRRVKSGELWAGRPAKHLRDLRADEIANILATARRYGEYAAQYIKEAGEAGAAPGG